MITKMKKMNEVRIGDYVFGQRVHSIIYATGQLHMKLADQSWKVWKKEELDKLFEAEVTYDEQGLSSDSWTEYKVTYQHDNEPEKVGYILGVDMELARSSMLTKWGIDKARFGYARVDLVCDELSSASRRSIPIDICERTKDGYLKNIGRRKVSAIYHDLVWWLKYEGLLADLDYFLVWNSQDKKVYDGEFPPFGWIECSVVTGGLEGHYIHVRAIDRDCNREGKNVAIFLGKTFLGMSHGYKVAQRIAELLGA